MRPGKNKVLSVGLDGKDILYPGPHIIKQGYGIAEFFGYINDGIFQSQKEVDDTSHIQDGSRVGGLKFRDVNGDGVVNADDRTTLGSPLAKVLLGLNVNMSYSNFDLTIFFDSKLGNKIWDNSKISTDFLGYVSNHGTGLLNAWSAENTGATIPALSNNSANFDKQASSYFISDGGYVRFKSVTLGYTLPKSILDKAKFTSLRFYVQAENILTITSFKGYDFETLNADLGSLGVTNVNNYPHSKAITFGLTLGF